MSTLHSRPSHRRGIAHIWTAIFLLVFVGFLGLATDTAWVVLVKQQLHNAADASALAGAAKVRADQDEARDAAVNLAALNAAASDALVLDRNDDNEVGGDVVIGRYNRNDGTFTPTTSGPNAVKVVMRRTDANDNALPLIFGPVFGTDEADVSASAIAMVGGGTGSGMLVLCDTCPCALDMQGSSSSVSVNDGPIQVNSSANCAVCNNGNPDINAPELNVVGGSCFSGDLSGELHTGVPVIADPLAGLPAPPITGPALSYNGNTATINPGRYPNGLNVKNNATLTMNPGIYIIDNGFKSKGFIRGNGVMIYMRSGAIDWSTGVSAVELSPLNPDDYPGIIGSDIYEHITVFQARSNTSTANMQGFSPNVHGTFYFPRNTVHIQGGSGAIGNQLIAWEVEVAGNGDVVINYDGAFPAPGNTVFLVE